jgi:hypothetical protein
MIIVWDNSIDYLECKINSFGAMNFFYRNRDTGEIWSKRSHYFDSEFLEKLKLFFI